MKKLISIITMIFILTANASAITLSLTGEYVEEKNGYSMVIIQGETFGVDNPNGFFLEPGEPVLVVFDVNTDTGELIDVRIVSKVYKNK